MNEAAYFNYKPDHELGVLISHKRDDAMFLCHRLENFESIWIQLCEGFGVYGESISPSMERILSDYFDIETEREEIVAALIRDEIEKDLPREISTIELFEILSHFCIMEHQRNRQENKS